MPRTIPIASAALQTAFLVVCLAAFSSAAVAAPAHRHAARSSAHAATHSASHKQAHAAHGSARTTHSAVRPSHSIHSVRSVRSELKPRSAAARRAHSRIREEVARRRRRHNTYFKPELRSARLIIPAPLRGSHESLVHQNQMAEAEGLERILDDADLNNRIASGSLVPVPISSSLHVNTDLPENRRYCRPWTAKFLTDLSRAHSAKFGGQLEVTSAVRTVEYQRHLRLVNGNAAAADGDVASPHLTGGTIDIGKGGLSSREIGWIRSYLIPLEQKGMIDVEEEFKQSCFHISVYRKYSESGQGTPTPAHMPVPAADGTMLAIHGR